MLVFNICALFFDMTVGALISGVVFYGFPSLVILTIIILNIVFVVKEKTCAIVERLGKFLYLARPGIRFKIPIIDRVRATISMRTNQLDVNVETKTLDNVFVAVNVSVQFHVIPEKVYEAYYTLENPQQQIKAFVFDIVRARVPELLLDDVFAKKDDIANAVNVELSSTMSEFGFQIRKTLITDISPDARVKEAMNEINVSQRERVAAMEKGEASKILRVKQAEAEAEAAVLHGKGIAGQREAIIDGLRRSVEDFAKQVDVSSQDVMNLVLVSQYMDMMKEIGSNSKSNLVFVQHEPDMANLSKHLRETIFAAKHDK